MNITLFFYGCLPQLPFACIFPQSSFMSYIMSHQSSMNTLSQPAASSSHLKECKDTKRPVAWLISCRPWWDSSFVFLCPVIFFRSPAMYHLTHKLLCTELVAIACNNTSMNSCYFTNAHCFQCAWLKQAVLLFTLIPPCQTKPQRPGKDAHEACRLASQLQWPISCQWWDNFVFTCSLCWHIWYYLLSSAGSTQQRATFNW